MCCPIFVKWWLVVIFFPTSFQCLFHSYPRAIQSCCYGDHSSIPLLFDFTFFHYIMLSHYYPTDMVPKMASLRRCKCCAAKTLCNRITHLEMIRLFEARTSRNCNHLGLIQKTSKTTTMQKSIKIV